jgi:cytochrome c-type biogenesis protein CcmF
MVTAHVTVFDRQSGQELAKMEPAKWSYRKPEDQVTTEVDKRMTLAEDLYLVLGAYDGGAGTAVLQMKINPLVNFVWIGCAFLMMGFSIAVWPDRRREVVPFFSRRTAQAAIGAATLMLTVLCIALSFL